jgi:D-alanine-D-alanine ligase
VNPLRVGITFDLASDHVLAPGMPHDRHAELDEPATIDAIEEALASAGHTVVRLGSHAALLARAAAGDLAVDVVFNVAEGIRGVAREAQVPVLLEALGVPYSGSDPLALAVTLDKGLTKRLWVAVGLPTAPYAVVADEAALARFDAPYPLFVKPVAEGSSMGIDADAVVDDRAALTARVRHVWRAYRQAALVEAYLPGPEFTVGILGAGAEARVLGVVRTVAAGALWDHHAKHGALTGDATPSYEVERDPALCARLGALALRAYAEVGVRDVGRVDVRMDARGGPQLLEINALPLLTPERSTFAMMATAAGMPYRDLIAAILAPALERMRGAAATGTLAS